MKKLFTEKDISDMIRKGIRNLTVTEGTIFTPSAKDKLNQAKIIVSYKFDQPDKSQKSVTEIKQFNSIAVGADHTGFGLKSVIATHLKSKGISVIDVGTYNSESCDYPDYALKVAEQVLENKTGCGIMIDATGIPSAITVNKLPGIRGATCYNEFTAKSAREHNNANILVIGAKAIGEETAKSIVDTWLSTKFAGGRHQKRLDKISKIEESLLKKSK